MKTFKQFIAESEHPMIDVDGVQKHRNNSEGQPIHHTDEGIRNFHRWFGHSDSVDHAGRPLVVHHATPALERGQTDDTPHPFNEFKHGDSGVVSFATSHQFAHNYASDKSHAAQMDKSPYVFSGYAKTKTFDPHNDEHIAAVSKHLGDTIHHQGKYGWGAFASKTYKTPDFMQKLKGIDHDKFETPEEAESKKSFDAVEPGKAKTIQKYDNSPTTMLHKNDTHMWVADGALHGEALKRGMDAAKTEPEGRHEVSFMHAPHESRPWHIERQKVTVRKVERYQPPKLTSGHDNWEYTENDHLRAAAQKAGFNAVKQTESGKHNIATFGTDQFKTKRNSGAFSHPTKIDE